MRILLIKMSSLGDVIHTFPALSDLQKQIPQLRLTWAIEPAFAPLAKAHPAVKTCIEIPIRAWRKNKWPNRHLMQQAYKALRKESYDIIIDAQGLMKSAIVAKIAKGKRIGYNKKCIKEPLARFFYQQRYFCDPNAHAIDKIRNLCAQALGYAIPQSPYHFGLKEGFKVHKPARPYLVFLHSTTWPTKHYPNDYWIALGKIVNDAGFCVYLPHGNDEEEKRSHTIAKTLEDAVVPKRTSLHAIAQMIVDASGVISVDTGLGHLSGALDQASLGLFGPTNAAKNGIMGPFSQSLSSTISCAPCLKRHCQHPDRFQTISPPCFLDHPPEKVWQVFCKLKAQKSP